ncbi:MAG: SAM-dependent methyltransferase, partial [Candidatus Woesearchaeota archaeon]
MKEGKNSLDFDFYFVSTPIGNMRDISNRALDILKSVDLVLCEDTRHTLKIFNKYAINTKMDSFHKHNYFFKIDNIIKKILEGKKMALVTDAGTPSISDPGKEIVEKLKSNNIKYTHIPGASAFLSAYVLSGFDTPFTFIG